MYDPIENGTLVNIQGLKCNIPPEGYIYNVLTKSIEYRGIYERSPKKEEQYWERIPLPVWYNQVMKQWDDFEKNKKDEDAEFYDERLEQFKRQEWDRRLNGLWVKINGVSTYLVGSHYMYMQ